MIELGVTAVSAFFAFCVICIVFVIVWAAKSESKIRNSRGLIAKFKDEANTLKSEKFILSEKLHALEGEMDKIRREGRGPLAAQDKGQQAPADGAKEGKSTLLLQAIEQNKSLEKENKKLKVELWSLKNTLEEIYNAAVEKKEEN